MRNDIKNELMEVLSIFQEGYIQRDVSKIDTFMNKLFDKDESIIIVGTSNGEWCLGFEEAQEIFTNDWQYWGDLRINAEEAAIIPLGDTALIYTTGSVKYTFCSNSDTYSRYLLYIKECFDGVSYNSTKQNKIKLTDIIWRLCHMLNKWEDNERNYLWDLRISFMLKKKSTGWIIKQMQFSLPVVGHLPDVRIDNNSYDKGVFEQETVKMKQYVINNTTIYRGEILKLLQGFGKDYLNKEVDISKFANKYFASQNLLAINTDKSLYNNAEEIKELIRNHRDYYEDIELDYENCLASSYDNVVWLITNGTFKKVIPESNAVENTVELIKNIYNSNLDDKYKLFKIRRSIAEMLKENARGEEYVWHLRFEAVLVKEDNNWVFKYLQFSLPFNFILEGKTEAASAL